MIHWSTFFKVIKKGRLCFGTQLISILKLGHSLAQGVTQPCGRNSPWPHCSFYDLYTSGMRGYSVSWYLSLYAAAYGLNSTKWYAIVFMPHWTKYRYMIFAFVLVPLNLLFAKTSSQSILGIILTLVSKSALSDRPLHKGKEKLRCGGIKNVFYYRRYCFQTESYQLIID